MFLPNWRWKLVSANAHRTCMHPRCPDLCVLVEIDSSVFIVLYLSVLIVSYFCVLVEINSSVLIVLCSLLVAIYSSGNNILILGVKVCVLINTLYLHYQHCKEIPFKVFQPTQPHPSV